jgi:hypothetical protein
MSKPRDDLHTDFIGLARYPALHVGAYCVEVSLVEQANKVLK